MKDPIIYHSNLIKDLNETIQSLLEVSDAEKRSDIASIRRDIEDIKNRLNQNSGGDFPYNKIRIRFENDYELKLPKYGLESFDRTLKGEMYFSILGGNDEYMDIKTNSFPETFRIRLYYKTLETYTKQKGKALLIYKRGREKLQGDETTIIFKIIKLS